jgi:hypothetical protein
LESITSDEILSFLSKITDGTKQSTKKQRYSLLRAFFNFVIDTIDPLFRSPCDTPILKKTLKEEKFIPWEILEKDLVDEIIFRTENPREDDGYPLVIPNFTLFQGWSKFGYHRWSIIG